MSSCSPDPTGAIKVAAAEYATSSPRMRPFMYVRYLFRKELAIFRSNAQFSLQALLLIAVGAIAICGSILHKHMDKSNKNEYEEHIDLELYGDDRNSKLFKEVVTFILIVSLPIVIDTFMSYLFLQREDNHWRRPREYTCLYMMLVLIVPNFFIYLQLIPTGIIDFIMFCQYILSYYALIYRIYSLTTTLKIVPTCPLRDMFFLAILAIFMGFFYKLATHNVIAGEEAFKALFTIALIGLQLLTCHKLQPWFNLSSHFANVVKNHNLMQNKTAFYAVMGGIILNSLVTVVHLATYEKNYIYFPRYSGCYVALEWLFCLMLISWTAIRSFEIKKSDLATAEQLDYNRKMTRSISHEIRTPLNTAFMALELLISSLAQQEASSKTTNRSADATELSPKAEKVLSASVVSDKQDSNSLLEIAESIKEGCDIALNILNQLLTFEKLSAGMLQLESKLLSVHQLLESNMKLFKMQAQQCGITFRLDSSGVDVNLLHVFVDEHKMNQVLRNLLSNAMKFTPRGGVVEVRLQWIHSDDRAAAMEQYFRQASPMCDDARIKPCSVSSSDDAESIDLTKSNSLLGRMQLLLEKMSRMMKSSDVSNKLKPINLRSNLPLHHNITGTKNYGTLLVSIVDSGPGVTYEDQKKLFQEYVQINPGELQKGQGTGLGLSISKSIVHLHGGNIGMTSEGKGKGSTFYVELPAYRRLDESRLGGRLYDSAIDHSKASTHIGAKLFQSPSRRVIEPGSSHSGSSTNPRQYQLTLGSHHSGNKLQQVNTAISKKAIGQGSHLESVDSEHSTCSLASKGAMHQPFPAVDGVVPLHNAKIGGDESNGSAGPGREPLVGADFTDHDDIEHGNAQVSHRNIDDHKQRSAGMTQFFMSLFEPAIRPVSHYSRIAPATSSSGRSALTSIHSMPGHTRDEFDHNGHHGGGYSAGVGDTLFQVVSRSKSEDDDGLKLTAVAPDTSQTTVTSNKPVKRRMSFVTPPKSYRILVVDDSAPNRKMLSRLLSKEHHTVIEASDGSEAVKIVQDLLRDRENTKALIDFHRNNRQVCSKIGQSACLVSPRHTTNVVLAGPEFENGNHPVADHASIGTDQTMDEDVSEKIPLPPMFDLILMDYYMPNMNGPAAIEAIRKLGYTGMIVGVSGVMDDDVNYFVQAGANLVLCKPLTLTALWKALRGTTFFDEESKEPHVDSLPDETCPRQCITCNYIR